MARNRDTEDGRQKQNADARNYRTRRRAAASAQRTEAVATADAARPAPHPDTPPGGCEVCGSATIGRSREGCDGCGREFAACCRASDATCRDCAGSPRPDTERKATPAPTRPARRPPPITLSRAEAALWRQAARDHDLSTWPFVRRRLLAQWCRHEATAVALAEELRSAEGADRRSLLVARARETQRAALIVRQLGL